MFIVDDLKNQSSAECSSLTELNSFDLDLRHKQVFYVSVYYVMPWLQKFIQDHSLGTYTISW